MFATCSLYQPSSRVLTIKKFLFLLLIKPLLLQPLKNRMSIKIMTRIMVLKKNKPQKRNLLIKNTSNNKLLETKQSFFKLKIMEKTQKSFWKKNQPWDMKRSKKNIFSHRLLKMMTKKQKLKPSLKSFKLKIMAQKQNFLKKPKKGNF